MRKRTLYLICLSLLLMLGVTASQMGQVFAQTATETPTPDPAVPAATPTIATCPRPAIADPDPIYYVGLADVYFARGQYTSAIEVYTCAVTLQPDYAPAYVKRGYAYAALLDNQNAMADYEHALVLDEALISAYNNRGTLYTRLGNFGLAIGDFTLAIGLNPNDPVAYNNRGVVHAIEGNFDLALADFEQAITLAPEFAVPYASLGAVYSALAAQNYQRYVDVAGDTAGLPAGTPGEVLTAVDDSLRSGDFSVWLSLLTPAR